MIKVDPSIPKMSSASGVSPALGRIGGDIYLSFYLAEDDEISCLLRFSGVKDWHYGYPNDEALDSHPLFGHGLQFYEFHKSRPGEFGECAWIATFHDGTFTVYARSVHVVSSAFSGSPEQAIDTNLGLGTSEPLDER